MLEVARLKKNVMMHIARELELHIGKISVVTTSGEGEGRRPGEGRTIIGLLIMRNQANHEKALGILFKEKTVHGNTTRYVFINLP